MLLKVILIMFVSRQINGSLRAPHFINEFPTSSLMAICWKCGALCLEHRIDQLIQLINHGLYL